MIVPCFDVELDKNLTKKSVTPRNQDGNECSEAPNEESWQKLDEATISPSN